MRLHIILSHVKPTEITPPSICPYKDCRGTHFRFHQKVKKPLKDTVYPEVTAHRYECLQCGRTFRVYPQGVTKASTPRGVKRLAVLLYLLGLSYGAVSLALATLGAYMSKSSVCEAVQAVTEETPGLKRKEIFGGIRTPAMGGDVTSVKCDGQWLSLRLTADETAGLVLTVYELSREEAETLREWIEPMAEAVGADLLVTDDADAFKTLTDKGLTSFTSSPEQ